VKDGAFAEFTNLSFENDASPSKPFCFEWNLKNEFRNLLRILLSKKE
jgi:hypothetical protein